jgi:hypothetical protein
MGGIGADGRKLARGETGLGLPFGFDLPSGSDPGLFGTGCADEESSPFS